MKRGSCGRINGLKILKLLYKRSRRISINKLSLPFQFLVHKVIRTIGRKRIGLRLSHGSI